MKTVKLFLAIWLVPWLADLDYLSAATHYVWSASPAPKPPYGNWETAASIIQDAVDAAAAGDEVVVTNGVYALGGRAVGTYTLGNRVLIDKPLLLRSVNGPDVTTIIGGASNRCVYLASGARLEGFTLTQGKTLPWSKFTSPSPPTIETSGGGLWCSGAASVSNCVVTGNAAGYMGGGAYGGALSNCIMSSNSAVMSGGGTLGSILDHCTLRDNRAAGERGSYGGGASKGTLNDCVVIGNYAGYNGGGVEGAMLNNCVLSNNRADWGGGGASGGTLNNCVLATNSAYLGGGADGSTLNNCVIYGNSAGAGGGASGGTLNNCTVTGNSGSQSDGGAYGGILNNCIVYFNNGGNKYEGTFNYCCTTPIPSNGVGNFTNGPMFLDPVGGNLRLQANSPCINAGNNAYAAGATDLDGRPRIVNATVDIGAYEYQTAASGLFIGWLQHYGLPTGGAADYTDLDGDGLNNWQEWRCQTDPTNALLVLRLLSATPAGANVTVTWLGVSGVNYFVERSTNLGISPPFTPLATNILGASGTNNFIHTNSAFLPGGFYRVGVGPP